MFKLFELMNVYLLWYSFSTKQFNFVQKDVREYKDRRYILDSGGHKEGVKGISVYLLNDNIYFQVVMSPEEDIMIWTVRTPIYTVR